MPSRAVNLLLRTPAFNPLRLGSLAAWYDVSRIPAAFIDGSNRVSLIPDLSGNSDVNGLVLNGVSGNYASAPDSAALSITGDIDIRINLSLPSWVPSSRMGLVTKHVTTANQRSYWFTLETSGNLIMAVDPLGDGAGSINYNSGAATGFANYSTGWVRAAVDVNNGAGGSTCRFYTSTDGANWTQLGTDQTGAVTSIFNSTAALNVGARTNGADLSLSGIIYRAQIYNGIAGTLAFDANFTAAAKLATSFTESSANAATVTINASGDLGARICGERDVYQYTAANKLTHASGALTGDGATQYARSGPWSLANGFTRYTVGSMVAWSSGKYLLDGASAANSAGLVMTTSTPQLNINAGSSVAGNTNLAVGATGAITETFNGASSALGINRTTETTGNAGATAANGVTWMASGASTAANFANGTIREQLIFSAVHSAATKARVQLYLAKKHGITI